MKLKSILFAFCLSPLSLVAQPDFSELVKQKIAALDIMVGTWEGTGYISTPTGRDSSNVVENIQYKLDGTVLFVEGKGTIDLEDGTQKIVHEALGIFSFNPFTKAYQMNSFISKGMSTLAQLKIVDDTHIVWWFEAGPTTIRYSIEIANDQWTEIGERSMDGENWQQFFEMKLKKVG